jgi:leukotriene-A4 hydrolase
MVRKWCHVKSFSLKSTLLYLTFSSQANASHFWLNEGWTTYIERVLLQVLHSPAERGFSFVIGSKALIDSLKEYEDRPKYQRLSISFEKGEDPDDAYSSIPYEKGANFILHLGE